MYNSQTSEYEAVSVEPLDMVIDVAREQLEIVSLPYNQVRLTNGILLEISAVSPETINAIVERYARIEPKPPMVFLKTKGRQEPNPNDPKFVNAHNTWAMSQARALSLVVYVFAMNIVDLAGNPGPDDEGVLNKLRLSNTLDSDTPEGRLVAWMRNFALSKVNEVQQNEMVEILTVAGRVTRGGVNESDAKEAVKRT